MKDTNSNFLSMNFPIIPIALPIVKAASTVPIPSPFICPKKTNVIIAVVKSHVTSKIIFTLGY